MNKKIIYVVVGVVVVVVAASLLTDGVMLGPFGSKRAIQPAFERVAPEAQSSALQPVISLEIPTPDADRMSPAPVFASIDFDASNLNGGAWEQARILWKIERDGGFTSEWNDKYRYVTDPRPGSNQGNLVDLSGQQFDSGDYNGPRGFNMAWMLTEGTWRVTAEVTNINRETVEFTSGDIVIAPNTRTVYTVGGGRDYPNLSYAFDQNGSDADIEYVIAGNHIEDRSGDALEARGDNAYIRWDGSGNRPSFRWTTDSGSYPDLISIHTNAENQVWEGIQLEDISGGGITGSTKVSGFSVDGSFASIVNCVGSGSEEGNRLNRLVIGGFSAPTGLLIHNTTTEATRAYSLVYQGGRTFSHSNVIGCDFGPSTGESVVRTTAYIIKMNILHSKLTDQGSKSSLRFVKGLYQHAYGNYLTGGEAWLGRVDTNDPVYNDIHSDIIRFEANNLGGVNGNILVRQSNGDNMTIVNNIIDSEHNKSGVFTASSQGNGDGHEYIRLLSNTINTNHTSKCITGDHQDIRMSESRANLVLLKNPSKRKNHGNFVDIDSDGWIAFSDSVYVPKPSSQEDFGEVDGGEVETIADWNNNYAFTSNEQEVDTILLAGYVPDPMTNVTTPDGVYDDYYGSPRGAISAAGAVTTWAPECGVDGDCVPGECQTNGQCVDSMCVYTNVADGTSCDNGLYCDGTETCQSGSCVGSGNPCLTDFACIEGICDEGEDFCSLFYNHAYCDDSNQCTEDSCTGAGPEGCSHNILVDSPCDDGDSCTENDICTELELQGVGTVGVCGGSMITQCNNITSDGCCPVGCDDTNDNDCSSCGNGFEFGGMCWFAGELGESCETVCEDNGKSCVQDNWNDDTSCTVCRHYFPGASCWDTNNQYIPAYKTACRYRPEGTTQSCVSSSAVDRRLCVCE